MTAVEIATRVTREGRCGGSNRCKILQSSSTGMPSSQQCSADPCDRAVSHPESPCSSTRREHVVEQGHVSLPELPVFLNPNIDGAGPVTVRRWIETTNAAVHLAACRSRLAAAFVPSTQQHVSSSRYPNCSRHFQSALYQIRDNNGLVSSLKQQIPHDIKKAPQLSSTFSRSLSWVLVRLKSLSFEADEG